jgi:hypothetical protein
MRALQLIHRTRDARFAFGLERARPRRRKKINVKRVNC